MLGRCGQENLIITCTYRACSTPALVTRPARPAGKNQQQKNHVSAKPPSNGVGTGTGRKPFMGARQNKQNNVILSSINIFPFSNMIGTQK